MTGNVVIDIALAVIAFVIIFVAVVLVRFGLGWDYDVDEPFSGFPCSSVSKTLVIMTDKELDANNPPVLKHTYIPKNEGD